MAEKDILLDTMNEQFILELFNGAIRFKSVLEIVCDNVQENYLPEDSQKKLLVELREQFKLENKIPTYGTLKLAFRKEREMLYFIDNIREQEDDTITEDVLVKTLEKFIRQSKFLQLFNEVGDDYNRNKKQSAFNKFLKGAEDLQSFTLTGNLFENVFSDFHKRNAERMTEDKNKIFKIPFGIDELDRRTRGGAESGEVVLWIAQSKGGKSFALNHCGLHASRLEFGVVHFQLEGTKRQCFNRYDSAWTGTKYGDIKEANIAEHKFKKINQYIRNAKSDISVYAPERFNGMTMLEIRRQVKELKKKRKIHLVIIDYLDLANPDNDYYASKDERFRQQKTARMMKELAMEENVVVVTATQASNIPKELVEDPNFVITRENLAEDKGKLRPMDMLISINRNKWEEKNEICRLFCDAMREHAGGDPIYIRQSLDYSKFYQRKKTLENPVSIEEYPTPNENEDTGSGNKPNKRKNKAVLEDEDD